MVEIGMRERIARAIDPYANWERQGFDDSKFQHDRELAFTRADAVLAAMREPNEEMIEAGQRVGFGHSPQSYYTAMIGRAANDSPHQ